MWEVFKRSNVACEQLRDSFYLGLQPFKMMRANMICFEISSTSNHTKTLSHFLSLFYRNVASCGKAMLS
jgi:hypothetical protein